MERDPMTMSDIDDASSQVKSRGDTYYAGSISPTGSCSISPLHISSPNVVTSVSDSLPPQIHVRTGTNEPLARARLPPAETY